jgi:hypothetical protein
MGDGDEPDGTDSAEQEAAESSCVESGEKTQAKAPKDRWDKLQAFSPLITGVVLALIGYFLTNSVNQGFQRSQLQFNYVKEMQELLAKLGDPKTGPEEAKTIAVALAAFGSYSIPPLLNEIESLLPNRQTAGESGLRAVALADPNTACPWLGRVLENRTAAYNFFTHRAAIRILGSANCQVARPVLSGYQFRLNGAASSPEGFTAFQAALADVPSLTKENVDQLKSELEKALKLLEQGRLQQ